MQREDLRSLLSAASFDITKMSIRSSSRFEAMLVAISNGADISEEEVEQVLRRHTL